MPKSQYYCMCCKFLFTLALKICHISFYFQSQQVSKKKKKKKAESLLGAPFHLKDGDTIGIKVLIKPCLCKNELVLVWLVWETLSVFLIFLPESFDWQQQGLCHPGGWAGPAEAQRAGRATQERVGLQTFKWHLLCGNHFIVTVISTIALIPQLCVN